MNAEFESDLSRGLRQNECDIAIVGMACRFPGASSLQQFWNNLANGIESIARLSDEQITRSGVPRRFLNDPGYVKAAPVLEGPGLFDAAFFGFSPTEARAMDPQHRILLELAHEALEEAGCDPDRYTGRIGVFTGAAMNTYLMNSGLTSRFAEDYIPTLIVNDKDFLSTRISYKLNLKGPSLTVQTACSTSLVAIHLARQSLLSGESDMALAGAISVRVPHEAGYFCDGNRVVSPDGHVRAFSADANGTVFGSGGGIIVLKRLEDAIADHDTIHAVIKGSAINNDGSEKAGYTAPSVNSQADAVVEALANSGLDADSISYVEAHGSGTSVGDPIELAALTKAFQSFTQRRGFCAIGSVKTNVGHLDAAAGIAGLIKTVLALKHRKIPASLNYAKANLEIDFAATPFYVNTELADWKGEEPRRAGVMSTGMGGTNAHVVLEEAPPPAAMGSHDLPQLFVLSARNRAALDSAAVRLRGFLEDNSTADLANVAHTLQIGRKAFPHRRILVVSSRQEAIATLSQQKVERASFSQVDESKHRPVIFLLPGIGDHYVGMGHGLYQNWKVFRDTIDLCAGLLESHLHVDIRKIIYPDTLRQKASGNSKRIDLKAMLGRKDGETNDIAATTLAQTIYAQPALFVIEYALASLWQSLGVTPEGMVGHSMGEYVAACLAGVFSLDAALRLIACRASLANRLPQGAMLAALLSEKDLLPLLNEEVSIALINGPSLCVVAGSVPAITELGVSLNEKGVLTRQVRNPHPFHSRALEPIVPEFLDEVRKVKLSEPKIPFTSNTTGKWLTNEEATSPEYWARHACETARFDSGLQNLWRLDNPLLLEVGPGKTLGVLAAQDRKQRNGGNLVTASSLRHDYEDQCDNAFLLQNIGKLWLSGAQIDWEKLPHAPDRRKIPLPTYPFERANYWLQTVGASEATHPHEVSIQKNPDLTQWFYVPSWKRTLPKEVFLPELTRTKTKRSPWLVFANTNQLVSEVIGQLKASGRNVLAVKVGGAFQQLDSNTFVLSPNNPRHYDQLIAALCVAKCIPGHILHAWALDDPESGISDSLSFQAAQDIGFYSILAVVRALAAKGYTQQLDVFALSNGIQEVDRKEILRPDKSTQLGPCIVIPQEYPNIRTKCIDLGSDGTTDNGASAAQILGELFRSDSDLMVAYRNYQRWVQTYEQVELDILHENCGALRQGGVYLITGGLGSIGYTIAKYLATTYRAKLVLLGRHRLPEKKDWDSSIADRQGGDLTSDKIAKIAEIEKLGGEVLYSDAKLTDSRGMHDIFERAIARFGTVNGVIHIAGVTGAQMYRDVKTVDREHGDEHFQLKAQALLILEELVRNKTLDFVLLTSSLTSILGGVGHSAYAASCSFMDSFAHRNGHSGATPWLSVNWDVWRVGERTTSLSGLGRTIQDLGMTDDEALQALEMVLPLARTGQVLVSTGDLRARLNQWVRPASSSGTRETRDDEDRPMLSPRANLQTSYEAPRDETESRVTAIWQCVLGIDQVGINDNFSDLGGHSLLAIKIIAEMRKAFQVDLPIRALFEAPTVATLSQYLKNDTEPASSEKGRQDNEHTIRQDNLLEEIRTTYPELHAENAFIVPQWFVQQTTWLEDTGKSDSVTYNYPLLLRVHGELNEEALLQSLREIVRRHEVFRSVFRAKDGVLVQIVVQTTDHKLPVTEFGHLDDDEKEAGARQFALGKCREAFDFRRDSLLRTGLLRLDAQDHILQVTTHHLVYDDWSTAVFSRELSQLYQSFANGETSPLEELDFQYGDFVRRQQAELQGAALESKRSTYKRQLSSPTGFYHLATDFTRPEKSGGQGAREAIILSSAFAESLQRSCRQERVSLFMLLVAAFKCLLHHSSNNDEIGIGSCAANRPFAEAEELVGRFGNAMLLRTNLSGDPTFRELLGRVRATALAAYSNQDLPFGEVVRMLSTGSEPPRPPFQVMFILQNAPQGDPKIPGLSTNWSPFYNETAKYDLDVWLKADPAMEIIFEYRTELFRAETIQKLLADYRAILEAALRNPGVRISDLGRSNKNEAVETPPTLPNRSSKTGADRTLQADAVQTRLLALWRAAFRMPSIGLDQDFFELGGDSLLAARLFPQIEKAFAVTLPLAALLETPTIRQLAQRVMGEKSDSLGSCLVSIQTAGRKPPLFCVHGHMGEVFYCHNLSYALGGEQPLYGLRSYGLENERRHRTIEEMAVHNLKEIHRVQTQGPYYLCGYCLGGMVAYEMAKLLTAEGEKVALLALFNTPAPGSFKDWPFGRAYLMRRIAHELKKLGAVGIRGKLEILAKKATGFVSLALGRLKTFWARLPLAGAAKAQQLLSVADINVSAAKAYAPAGYSGRITLFLTKEASSLYSVDPISGWTALAREGTDVLEVAGDNNSMFGLPFVGGLAEKLNAAMAQARELTEEGTYSGTHLKYANEARAVSTAAAPM